MKTLFLLLGLFSAMFLSAQSYNYVPFPDSARWTYYAHVQYGSSFTFTITALGDTSISGMINTKLFFDDGYYSGVYIGGLRESDKKVYFRSAYGDNSPVPYVAIPDSSANQDELIYDFSVDSFLLFMPWYGIQYEADSLGYAEINGDYRKVY